MEITNEYLKDLYNRSVALGYQYADIDGFKYVFNGKYCILKGINLDIINNNTNIIVPDYFDKAYLEIEHQKVVGEFKELNFGKRMSYIESICFGSSLWLSKVVAPGLIKLGNNCFSYSRIHELEAPNLIEIGSECFRYSSIISINCPKLKRIGKGCFSECRNLQFIDTKNVIKLESDAFFNCVNLRYLNLNSLSHFRLNSISNCNLEKLELKSVKSITNSYKICSYYIKDLLISSDYNNINKFFLGKVTIENLLLCNSGSNFNLSLFKSKLYNDNIKVLIWN